MRRLIALFLWAYFGWYAAALLFDALGWNASFAPIGAVLMGAVALYDWRPLRTSPAFGSAADRRRESQRMS